MTREEARNKAAALVDKMSIEEMTTQLRYDAKAIDRLNIPEYNWWGEALHGVARAGTATIFPQAIGMAATFDEDIVKKVGEIVSTEARAKYNAYSSEEDRDIYKGLTMWSPNVNIFRDPRWGRGHETYGEDPYLTSRLGVSYVKGLQGDGEHLKVAACAKHFAVHSGPEADRHHFDAHATKKDLRETYLPAFEACVKEGNVEAVMGAYNRFEGEPCCANTVLMQDILRGEWGFEGHYVSDCWAIKDFHENHMVTKNPRESVALALNKGCDVNCGSTYLCMLQAYKEKLITKEQIRESAIRLFTTRYLLGLFDGSEYDDVPYSEVASKEHIAYSKYVADRSIVMLKNDGILPLDKNRIKTIGIIGPNADHRSSLDGNYHGTAVRYRTISESIQDEVADDDIRVYFSVGSHLFKDKCENLARNDDRISEAVTVAKNSDVVILCVGLDETLEGEEGDTGNSYASGDKTDLELPACQRRLVEAVAAVGKPIILINVTGSAMNLSYAKNDPVFGAILQAFYPGQEGGRSVSDIIFGRVSPSGKLPVTFYESLDELPDFTDYGMKGRTYRYLEGRAQYPFGFGLTYGKVMIAGASVCDMKGLKADLTAGVGSLDGASYEVELTAFNDSDAETEEVAQIYIRSEGSEYAVKNHSLCGFKRFRIGAYERKTFRVTIPGRAFLVYDDNGERILDSGKFTLYAGVSQPDEESCRLEGFAPVVIKIG